MLSDKYSRIHRLLKILTLIQSGPGWTAGRIAEQCAVSKRTVYRDIQILDAAGIPILFDPENPGYRVRQDFFMPPVDLSADESLALVTLGDRIGRQEQIPFTAAAARAVAKVKKQLPAPLQKEIDQLDPHLHIYLAPTERTDTAADVYQQLRYAISHGTAVRCTYEAGHRAANNGQPDDTTDGPFLFLPYCLFFCHRAWYTTGYHEQRREVRCLKLNRFASIEPSNRRYHIPRSFDLESHLGNAWRMIRGETTHNIELRFDPDFAETVADTQWHPTQEIQWQDDRSLLMRFRIDGLDEIVWWILSMGPHCRVLNPPELIQRVRNLAAQTAAIYDD